MKRIILFLYHSYLIFVDPIKYAKHLGVSVGEGTRFKGIKRGAFSTEPYLIKIGKNCLITAEVQFITHDGSVYLLKRKYSKLGLYGKITLGNNVFIGCRSIILPGVIIGDNVVVGAGSVVTRSIPSNSVTVGVPAKVVSSLDDYLKKIEGRIIPTSGMKYKEKKKLLLGRLSQ